MIKNDNGMIELKGSFGKLMSEYVSLVAGMKEKQMENRFVTIHCPYTGRNYIYTKTIVNGKICVDIVRID